MSVNPLTPNSTRTLLETLGHTPNKRLGQNFLIDGNIVRKSLQLAQVSEQDDIIEIGPGLGTLTRAMLDTGARVHAVEYDPRLSHHLRETLAKDFGNTFHLMEGDAVDHPTADYTPQHGSPYKVVANLPYAIATPWLERLLRGPLPGKIVVMLQKEAADRYCAQPGSKHFGTISILLDGAYNREPGHRVSRSCFYPIPKIDSLLLSLTRKAQPYLYTPLTHQWLRQLFTLRRKQITTAARHCLPEDVAQAWLTALQQLGLPGDRRAEALPAPAWQHLDAISRTHTITSDASPTTE